MAQGPEPSGSSLDFNDILFVLLKHKWKIIILAVLGLAGAAVVYTVDPPMYESEAKLMVKYVLERNFVDQLDRMSDAGRASDNSVIFSELEILQSWDLARATAAAVGPKELLPDDPAPTETSAASKVLSGLRAEVVKGTNVISVVFKHEKPDVAQKGLTQLVHVYKEKHLDLHRPGKAVESALQDRDAAKTALNQVEASLTREKKSAQIVSLHDTVNAFSTALARTQLEIYDAETERAAQIARVETLERSLGAQGAAEAPGAGPAGAPATVPDKPLPSPAEVQDYQLLVTRLGRLRQQELDLFSKFQPGSSTMQGLQQQIASVESQMRDMERRHPELLATAATSGGAPSGQFDLVSERIKLQAIEARLSALRERLDLVMERAQQFADIEPRIADLLRNKEINETNYKLISERLKRSEIDAKLDSTNMPNMGFVQEPSPAMRIGGDRKKAVVGLAGGGVGLGLALAFLIELVFNRTVKRPLELETRVGLPLMLSIPMLSSSKASRRALKDRADSSSALARLDKANGSAARSPWDVEHFIRPFAEAIRDRLVLYFELSKLTRKPKLVAVTGLRQGAGVSTLAGGLAAALSETGDGKVLLVDMNVNRTEIQPFLKGQAVCSLYDALQPSNEMSATADNLYLATAVDTSAGPMQLVPKRFYDLIPHLKASAFDYIIFDMPAVSESSATLAIAGFMDKVLFVVEAEENNTDTLRRAVHEMTAARANVAGVFNKARSHAPAWMKLDL